MIHSFSNNISEEYSLHIRNQFLDLNSFQKKQLVKKISSRQRVAIIDIISNTACKRVSEGTAKILEKNILECNKLKNKVSLVTKATILHKIKKKIEVIVGFILNLFGYLTSKKANRLIKKCLAKTSIQAKKNDTEEQIDTTTKGKRSKVLQEMKVNQKKNLLENHSCTKIKNKIFSKEFPLENLNLEWVIFENCILDWLSCKNSTLKNVKFVNCQIKDLSLINCYLKNCSFANCDTREMTFTASNLDAVIFEKSALIGASFEDAFVDHCIFSKSALSGTHFFEAVIKNSRIIDCNLEDTIFFETLENFEIDTKSKKTIYVTRPTTAILVNPETKGISIPKAYKKLNEVADTIPIRIHIQTQTVTKEGINAEVEAALLKIGPYDKNKAPIPQRLISELTVNSDSESARILKKAEKLVFHVDSLFLPGGEDLPPALYGQEAKEKTNWGNDYRRSILEIGLIHQSFTKGVPLMAVCRGFQMSNVYFGAQLIQHIDGHCKVPQKFELSFPDKGGLYGKAMENSIVSASFHHQAVLEKFCATQHLQTSVRYDGVVKAVELDKSGVAPMVLLQFHPEFYKAKPEESMKDRMLISSMSKENEMFWQILSDSAKAQKIKKMALNSVVTAALVDEKTLSQRKAKLKELEENRAKVLSAYKKQQFHFTKKL